jgi:hypothetical protein
LRRVPDVLVQVALAAPIAAARGARSSLSTNPTTTTAGRVQSGGRSTALIALALANGLAPTTACPEASEDSAEMRSHPRLGRGRAYRRADIYLDQVLRLGLPDRARSAARKHPARPQGEPARQSRERQPRPGRFTRAVLQLDLAFRHGRVHSGSACDRSRPTRDA